MAVESTALVLMERLDALAAALRDAGVSQGQSASLLASAASATMHALTLDALLDEPAPAPARSAASFSAGQPTATRVAIAA